MKGPAGTSVERTEIAGVPVLWADAPAPYTGCLTFRVGYADETFATRGLSHLVEHLALYSIGRQPYNFNGSASQNLTQFYASGSREEVGSFLSAVARGLAALPLDRLDTEKRILATESAGVDPGIDMRLLGMRYGVRGLGLGDTYEWALDTATADQVAAWAARQFTAGNAALWFTGAPPENLEVELPPGDLSPTVAPEPDPELDLPAYIEQGTGGVACATVAPRSPGAFTGFGIAGVRAHDRLRVQAGHSYSAGAAFQPMDRTVAHATLVADCDDRSAATVRDLLLGVLDELGEDGATAEEIAWQADQARRRDEDPASIDGFLNATAVNLLLGAELIGVPERQAELEAVTPDEIADALRMAAKQLIVCVPTDIVAERPEGFQSFPGPSTQSLGGEVHRPTAAWRESGETSELRVSDEGVTIDFADGTRNSIRFAQCVGVISALGGTVRFVEQWGTTLTVLPGCYERSEEIRERIRSHAPAGTLVGLSDREKAVLPLVEHELAQPVVDLMLRELDALPNVLSDSETVRHLALVTKDKRRGLLAVTSERVLFLFRGTKDEFWEVDRARIASADTKGLMSKRLRVTSEGSTTEFEDVKPEGRLAEVVVELEGS